MQDVCRETSSHSVADAMPDDRMELYLERIEQDLLKGVLATNNNDQTRASSAVGKSRRGL